MSRFATILLIGLLLLAACADDPLLGPDVPNSISQEMSADAPTARAAFPDVIQLPDGFQPEGIAVGPGQTFYVGSLRTGAILRGDLRTGAFSELVPADGAALGMQYDARSGLLWVAGGGLGTGTAYDAGTGTEVATFPFATGTTLVNDLAVTRTAAYFTDSFAPTLYVVPLGPAGEPADPSAAYALSLTGDYVSGTTPAPGLPAVIEANGIVATPNGRWLLVVNSTTGLLYRVDPATGYADEIDLDGVDPLIYADGLVLVGPTLYVVQNLVNQIAVVHLAPDLLSGELERTIRNGDLQDVTLDIPATAARFGSALYVVNANFDDADPFDPTPPVGVPFNVVRVPRTP